MLGPEGWRKTMEGVDRIKLGFTEEDEEGEEGDDEKDDDEDEEEDVSPKKKQKRSYKKINVVEF